MHTASLPFILAGEKKQDGHTHRSSAHRAPRCLVHHPCRRLLSSHISALLSPPPRTRWKVRTLPRCLVPHGLPAKRPAMRWDRHLAGVHISLRPVARARAVRTVRNNAIPSADRNVRATRACPIIHAGSKWHIITWEGTPRLGITDAISRGGI
jgi:hypothetical protein